MLVGHMLAADRWSTVRWNRLLRREPGGYLMKWYVKVLRQYADFGGRARRTEFWMFTLFSVIFSVVFAVIDPMAGLTLGQDPTQPGVLRTIYTLAVLVPSLAVIHQRQPNRSSKRAYSSWSTSIQLTSWCSRATCRCSSTGPAPRCAAGRSTSTTLSCLGQGRPSPTTRRSTAE